MPKRTPEKLRYEERKIESYRMVKDMGKDLFLSADEIIQEWKRGRIQVKQPCTLCDGDGYFQPSEDPDSGKTCYLCDGSGW
jgi:DnaJ-class molecular chaperone